MLHDWKFETDAGLTYDSDLIEIAGGIARLRPENDCAFLARWNTGLNADYSLGTLTATTAGAPVIDTVAPQFGAGCLELESGAAGEYTGYIGPDVANLGNEGTVRFGLRPAWAGAPAAARAFFSCGSNLLNDENGILVFQDAAGTIIVRIYDAVGVLVINWTVPAWVPVAGVWYDIELTWNATATYFFIDGVSVGVNPGGVTGRTAISAFLHMGNNRVLANTPDHAVDDFQVFPVALHTANFVPPAVEATVFSITDPTIQTDAFPAAEFRRFAEHMENTDGEVRYHLMENGVHREYYNGTAWVNSDGTYAQSSTAEQMVTGMPGHDPVHDEISVVIFLHSDDGISTPELGRLCIWTARFAVLAAVRQWLAGITAVAKSDEWFATVLSLSDRWVSIKLSKYPTLLVELPDTPEFTQALAEAAGCEAALRRAYSDEGESAENSDRKMWEGIRDELLRELLDGDLGVGPGGMLMTSNAQRSTFYPVFGYGEWSERILSTLMPASEAGYHEIREDVP